MQTSGVLSLSPSFSRYSNGEITEIAARVAEELRAEEGSEDFYGELYPSQSREKSESASDQHTEFDSFDSRIEEKEENSNNAEEQEGDGDSEDDDDDFEFAFVTRESQVSSPISADEIFCNGQIRPVFPVFNRDLLMGNVNRVNQGVKGAETSSGPSNSPARTIRLPLRKLFIEEERETASSSSSSEADELEGVPPESYCVWRQKPPAEEAEGRCKKSHSTGSAKRWRFRDLMHRTHSDGGKHTFTMMTPSSGTKQKENEKIESVKRGGGRKGKTPAATGVAAVQYTKNSGDRRRSYLPYTQDLVGLFSNVNGLSRNLQPF